MPAVGPGSGNEASLIAQLVKNLPANAGDLGSIPGSGRSPGEGNGNPLQYSCLENPMDRGAWQATVHGVARVRHDLVSKPPLAGNEGLAALTVLFHMFLKQSSHSIVPHPSRSRQNIPMQWVQVRQK